MKFKIKCCLCFILFISVFVVVMKIRYIGRSVNNQSTSTLKNFIFTVNKTIDYLQEITLLLRYNDHSPKQVATTINSFLSVFPSITIIIVSDTVIPKEIYHIVSNNSNIINIPLKLDLLNLIVDRSVAKYIKTKYVFIAPIGTISILEHEALFLIKVLNKNENTLIAVPTHTEVIKCLKLELNLLQWIISYKISNNKSECSSIKGQHGLLLHTKTLFKIGEPFLLPFPEAFYIQTTSLNLKVNLIRQIKLKFKKKINENSEQLYKSQIQRQIMYKLLKIKKVHREDGTIEWFGCTRHTPRCFPSIINSIPEYLNQGRWTPPCCLRVLRETVHHVFKILKNWNVTFWLEGGSLLGAMRTKDIIPWDYDVDIGIYLKDIDKCPWLHMVNLKTAKVLL